MESITGTCRELKESLQGVKWEDVPVVDEKVPSLLDVANVYQNCGLLEKCCKDFVHTLIEEAIHSGVPPAGRILVPGDVIFKEGDASGASLFLIYRGKVDVLLGQTKVATLGPPSHFGEMQLLGLSKFRTATAVVSEFAQLFEITPGVFSKCIMEFPRERKLFESIASRRFSELQEARKKKQAEQFLTYPKPKSPMRRSNPPDGDEEFALVEPGSVEPVDPLESACEALAMRQREAFMFRKLDAIPAVSVAARRSATATPTCGMRHGQLDESRQEMVQEEADDPPDVVRLPPFNDLCLDQQRWLHGQLLERAQAHANAEAMNDGPLYSPVPPFSSAGDTSRPRSAMTTPRRRKIQNDPRSTTSTPGLRRPHYDSRILGANQRHHTGSPSPAVKEVLAAVRESRRMPRRTQQLRPSRPQTAPLLTSKGRNRPISGALRV